MHRRSGFVLILVKLRRRADYGLLSLLTHKGNRVRQMGRIVDQAGATQGEDVWLEAESWNDNRRELRVPTALEGSVRLFLGASESVQVVDVSNRGCRLRGVTLKVAQRVWLRIGDMETQVGIVAWCYDGEVGVRFEQRLAPEVISLLAGRASGASDIEFEDI